MANLYLYLEIDTESAVKRGRSIGARTVIPLRESLLGSLSEEDRAELSRYVGSEDEPSYWRRDTALNTDGDDLEAIVAGLATAREKRATETAEKATEEKAIQALRDLPVGDLLKCDPDKPAGQQWEYDWKASHPDDVSESAKAEAVRLNQVAIDEAAADYSGPTLVGDLDNEPQLAPELAEILKTAAAHYSGLTTPALVIAANEECKWRRIEIRERKEAAVAAKVVAWVAAYGSKRLKRLLDEGIEAGAVYRDERLAIERAGWRWDGKVMGSGDEPRNPPVDALDLLDEARVCLPDEASGELQYWTVEACSGEHYDDHDDDQKCPGFHDGWRGYAVVSTFLGRDIVFGGPVDE